MFNNSYIKYYDSILNPIITEKSMKLIDKKKYCFLVHNKSNKILIKNAIKNIFKNIKVKDINIINTYKKTKKQKNKKAIITLSKNSKNIEFLKKI